MNPFARVSDVWMPPDSELDQQTGVVPQAGESERDVQASVLEFDHAAAQRVPGFRVSGAQHHTAAPSLPLQETAKVPVRQEATEMPLVRRESSPSDQALANVLVEGALLTAQRLEVLKGIQEMLASVDMRFKVGELALLFKFLSPDQLLAALLVSRGLVSPGQIAGLGRVKQELGASGMDYDLETLLVMFHIMPVEQLRQLRAELA